MARVANVHILTDAGGQMSQLRRARNRELGAPWKELREVWTSMLRILSLRVGSRVNRSGLDR